VGPNGYSVYAVTTPISPVLLVINVANTDPIRAPTIRTDLCNNSIHISRLFENRHGIFPLFV